MFLIEEILGIAIPEEKAGEVITIGLYSLQSLSIIIFIFLYHIFLQLFLIYFHFTFGLRIIATI